MKRLLTVILICLAFLPGCRKDDKPVYSGTETIDNELFGTGPYYALGFLVPEGRKVSTSGNPIDVIALFVDFDIDYSVREIYLSCNNFKDSFFKYGEYSSAADASQAFNNLKSFSAVQWTELGNMISPHQVWLFRSSDDRYAKIRIISTYSEKRDGMPFPFAECTFEWVFQPDGTQTFPKK